MVIRVELGKGGKGQSALNLAAARLRRIAGEHYPTDRRLQGAP
jgi:hypothetical protein